MILTITKKASVRTVSGVTSLIDSNLNPCISLLATASAVNNISIANASTGNNPTIATRGSDSNIGLTLSPKGTGILSVTANASNFSGTMSINTSSGAGQALLQVGVISGTSSTCALVASYNGNVTAEFHGTATGNKRASLQFSSYYSSTLTQQFGIGTDVSVNGTGDFFIYDNVNAATRFYIGSTGNVGIGTTSLTAKLTISGSLTATGTTTLATTLNGVLTSTAGVVSNLVAGTPASGNSGTPTVVYGTGANSPTGVSISGNGESGTITFTTGAIPVASGTVLTATFASSFAYAHGCSPMIYPGNTNAALLSGTSMLYSAGTTTTFVLTSGTAALTALTTYVLNYQIAGN